ncbi:PREDICTED: putative disease resistance RPP13-like protein 3 [Ipomoea nil]|uniref:putative disease resistance RPP13-like protein 3 n=1 Tax=Ipomoea nil TaxID=35883 RepID=UPI0009011292|nr:PREDICTED: putative disease resistance RPP13-like protein 3 [Ipomoea nil]
MDCIVVSSLLGIVDQLQLLLLHNKNNPCLILPEIDDAQFILSSLKDKLHFLQAYLHKPKPIITSDPDRDEAVKRLDEEIRDVAMKAEYEIESKLGEVYLAANQQGDGECAVAVEAAACEDLHRSLQQVVKDIESVEVRIRDLQTSSSSSSSTPPCLQLQNVRDGVEVDLENTIVGVEGDVEEIKGMLIPTSPSTQLQVVSIVGMGGTGCTTLAKNVYGDSSIESHFDIQAWTVEG